MDSIAGLNSGDPRLPFGRYPLAGGGMSPPFITANTVHIETLTVAVRRNNAELMF